MISTFVGIVLSLFGGPEVVYAAVEPPQVEIKEKSIEDKIREEFADAPVMIFIAKCESGFKNVPSKTGDFGPFQINQVHLNTLKTLGLDRTNVDDNIKFARYLYNQKGTQPWYMSAKCWQQY